MLANYSTKQLDGRTRTELLSELPTELQHKVFYFVAEHPVAEINKDFFTLNLELKMNV